MSGKRRKNGKILRKKEIGGAFRKTVKKLKDGRIILESHKNGKVYRYESAPPRRFKACDSVAMEIQKKADKYANGNFSAWVRYASRMYTPGKDEKIATATY
jgi:hypothetical protein